MQYIYVIYQNIICHILRNAGNKNTMAQNRNCPSERFFKKYFLNTL